MLPKGFHFTYATELSSKQITQLKNRIKSYSKLQEYRKPLTLNLSNRSKSTWLCILNSKKEVVGFTRLLISHKKRTITRKDTFVLPEYQRKGFARASLAKTIALARGLGRYSVKSDWLDPRTSKPMFDKFVNVLKERSKARARRGSSFKVGLAAHKFSKVAKKYIRTDYGGGKSFKAGVENIRKMTPTEPILKKGGLPTMSDGWIQMKQRKDSGNIRPGPKKLTKTLFPVKKQKTRRPH